MIFVKIVFISIKTNGIASSALTNEIQLSFCLHFENHTFSLHKKCL